MTLSNGFYLYEFFANKVFSWKTAKPESFVLPEWENQHTCQRLFESVGQCVVQKNQKNSPK